MTKQLLVLLCLLAFCFVANANADPINVTYGVTGAAGNWTVDFNVTNNLIGTDQTFYFFGVALSSGINVGTPIDPISLAPWEQQPFNPWSNVDLDGSSVLYNNTWVNQFGGALPGTTTSGFKVQISDLAPPASIDWFAFYGGAHQYCEGPQSFCTTNPGFEGYVDKDGSHILFYPHPLPQNVDEPATLASCGVGLGILLALAAIRRRRSPSLVL